MSIVPKPNTRSIASTLASKTKDDKLFVDDYLMCKYNSGAGFKLELGKYYHVHETPFHFSVSNKKDDINYIISTIKHSSINCFFNDTDYETTTYTFFYTKTEVRQLKIKKILGDEE